jgi:hypothetical protein
MAYKEYTKCVKPADFSNFGFNMVGYIAHLSLLFGVVWATTAAILIGGPIAISIAIAITFEAIIVMRWFLYGRLICLGDPGVCSVIGIVVHHSASDPALTESRGDNDYNMNLLLAPLSPADYADLRPEFRAPNEYWDPPQGHLLEKNQAVLNIGMGYPSNDSYLKTLHIEFEGDGVYNLLQLAYVTMAFLLAMLALWALGAGIGASIVALFVFILAFILPALGLTLWTPPGAPGSGNPIDVDDSFGNYALNLKPGDVVVVRGQWVYDSGHNGWNEIHPVRHGQVIGTLRKQDDIDDEQWRKRTWADFSYTEANAGSPGFVLPDEFDRFQQHWCGALDDAKSANDDRSRDKPENDWGLHPFVDGCVPSKPVTILHKRRR